MKYGNARRVRASPRLFRISIRRRGVGRHSARFPAVARQRRAKGLPPAISGSWRLSFNLDGLSRPRVIAAITGGVIVVSLSVLAVGAGSIKLVEYTESNEFCATNCHAVMAPEVTAAPAMREFTGHLRSVEAETWFVFPISQLNLSLN